ncbi:F-box domain-containing protein [Mycena sanguinolenta]|uniref:F-box domain-containing protein n=1 Tax=Mycena sanguinolenta TaxID=230812 RepID=A0A8H6YF93_9AGAR|nr:F-box domain-containing protein [Mycena sanguinolenta]
MLFFSDPSPLFEGYFSLPVEMNFAGLQLTPPTADEPPSKWILDHVSGENDTCSQCGALDGLELCTEANWDRSMLDGDLTGYLRDLLKLNQTILQPFYAATSHLVPSDTLGTFIGDLFAFKTHTTPEFDSWERTDSYCFASFTKFLNAHMWIWFFEERVRGGWVPPDNCWYGWNCHAQVHESSHAETKNVRLVISIPWYDEDDFSQHLCVPTKDYPV